VKDVFTPGTECVYWEQHKEWESELDSRFTESSDPEAAKAGKEAAAKKLKAQLDFKFIRDEKTKELTGFTFMHDVYHKLETSLLEFDGNFDITTPTHAGLIFVFPAYRLLLLQTEIVTTSIAVPSWSDSTCKVDQCC
jgi:hypothetical protein